MSLVNPKVPYKTIRDAILTLLQSNKTALNVDLTSTTFTANSQIMAGDPLIIPTPVIHYPVIMVKCVNKSEDFEYLGNAGRKRPRFLYRIYGIVRKVINNTTDDEVMALASNIEGLLRDNIDLSNNVLFCNPISAEFGIGDMGQGVYVDVLAIDLECIYEVK